MSVQAVLSKSLLNELLILTVIVKEYLPDFPNKNICDNAMHNHTHVLKNIFIQDQDQANAFFLELVTPHFNFQIHIVTKVLE